MPSAGEVLGASCGVENFMITDVISPAPTASTKAIHSLNSQLSALPADYATALEGGPSQSRSGMSPAFDEAPFLETGRPRVGQAPTAVGDRRINSQSEQYHIRSSR